MNAILVSAILGVVMMFSSIAVQKRGALSVIAVIGLVLLLAANLFETYSAAFVHPDTHGMLRFTRFGLYFNTVIFAATLVYFLLSGKEITESGNYPAEYYALLFFVLCGASVLSSAENLLMLFLGIEILSIPLYILTGSDKRNLKSNEASLKYFLMGAFSTGLMLMGIALVYGGTGTFALAVNRTHSAGYAGLSFLEVMGLLMLLASMAFKVSVAPFHFWTPDVYDGAPTVFTSFMSTIVKAAGFIAFLKLFESRVPDTAAAVNWRLLFGILIVATLLVGNITAVFQQSVKRMLAYSSIAQAGFMMMAIFSLNDLAKEGLIFYAAAYSLATIGLFAVLVKMKDYTLEGYNGLAKRQPVIAAACAVFLLSLSGIPLTAGFFAKYYMIAAVIKSGGDYLWLAVAALVFAAVSVYYYFRVIQAMYFRDGEPETDRITAGFRNGLVVLAAVVVLLGIFPDWLTMFFYF